MSPSSYSFEGGTYVRHVLKCEPWEDSSGSYVGGLVEICFQTLVEPSREAVTAKDGSGSRTART